MTLVTIGNSLSHLATAGHNLELLVLYLVVWLGLEGGYLGWLRRHRAHHRRRRVLHVVAQLGVLLEQALDCRL